MNSSNCLDFSNLEFTHMTLAVISVIVENLHLNIFCQLLYQLKRLNHSFYHSFSGYVLSSCMQKKLWIETTKTWSPSSWHLDLIVIKKAENKQIKKCANNKVFEIKIMQWTREFEVLFCFFFFLFLYKGESNNEREKTLMWLPWKGYERMKEFSISGNHFYFVSQFCFEDLKGIILNIVWKRKLCFSLSF